MDGHLDSGTLGSAIDGSSLAQLIGDERQHFASLLLLCTDSFPRAVASLREALGTESNELARSEAHAIKGMLLNLCASRGCQLASELEGAIAVASWPEARARLDDLDLELGRVLSELQKLCVG